MTVTHECSDGEVIYWDEICKTWRSTEDDECVNVYDDAICYVGKKCPHGQVQHDFGSYSYGVDYCLSDIIEALNKAGIFTSDCCCGHGNPEEGYISLMDGRVFRTIRYLGY